MSKPFEGVATATEAGYADDLRVFSVRAMVRRGRHIRVEALEMALPTRGRRGLWAVQDALRLAFWGFGAWVSLGLADRTGVMPMDSRDASLAWVYWPVFGGFVLMFLRGVQWVWRRWRHGDAPSEQDVLA